MRAAGRDRNVFLGFDAGTGRVLRRRPVRGLSESGRPHARVLHRRAKSDHGSLWMTMTYGAEGAMALDEGAAIGGLRILVVEDEVAIAMLLEDMLLDLGGEVVGPAGRIQQALGMAETESFDVAILDVNVSGQPIYPVVEVLQRRGIPFVFSTGYGSAGIDAAWRDRPVLQKPFSQDELERVLKTVRDAG